MKHTNVEPVYEKEEKYTSKKITDPYHVHVSLQTNGTHHQQAYHKPS